MHNCYYYLILIVLLIKLYAESMLSYKIDQTIYLVNEQLITSCITKKSLLEYYSDGITSIRLDPILLKEKVDNTLTNNLPSKIKVNTQYYFYDCFSMEAYTIQNNKCNSVQIKITLEYLDKKVEKYLHYQLVENYESII